MALRLLGFGLVLFVGCEADDLSATDAGIDAGAEDAGAGGVDAAMDAGSEDAAFPCDPFRATSPGMLAPTTGQIDIVDYDYFDEIDGRRARVRNAGVNFFTGNLGPYPLNTAALFPGVPIDGCVGVDFIGPPIDPRPARNIGARISIANEAGTKSITIVRASDRDGLSYEWPTTLDVTRFFDPAYLAFGERWTYHTDGDPSAGIGPATAVVEPFDDFLLIAPAVSSSSTAVALDPAGIDVTWTSTGTKGIASILLGRALNMTGDARYLICRVEDDGAFTIDPAALADFGPVPGLPFDFVVSRASAAPFCNEGVPSGAVLHVVAYIGAGVL
jgi:hypothetical protein